VFDEDMENCPGPFLNFDGVRVADYALERGNIALCSAVEEVRPEVVQVLHLGEAAPKGINLSARALTNGGDIQA
jgi:hypothetical protein